MAVVTQVVTGASSEAARTKRCRLLAKARAVLNQKKTGSDRAKPQRDRKRRETMFQESNTKSIFRIGRLTAIAMTALSVGMPMDAFAQLDEIVVYARKREESILKVPVVATAISRQDIERYNSSTFEDIGQFVPGLIVADGAGADGGALALRGISSPFATPTVEKSVAINIDGMQLSQGNALRTSQIDLQQVEILKGPQALFFGKNSTAGIIAVRTADPTDEFEARLRGGYEINAEEKFGELIVSGPVTESLGARLVVYGNDLDGWVNNGAVAAPGITLPGPFLLPVPAIAPQETELPNTTEFFTRATLLFEPNEDLNIRAKVSYNFVDGAGQSATTQVTDCPNGAPVFSTAGPAGCRADDLIFRGDIPADHQFFLTEAPDGFGGKSDSKLESTIGIVELNYNLTESIAFTSVTGVYDNTYNFVDNFGFSPNGTNSAAGMDRQRIYSEEVRLTSDFESRVNGMVGFFYENRFNSTLVQRVIDGDLIGVLPGPIVLAGLPVPQPVARHEFDSVTYSVFGQLLVDVTEDVELSGGLRYTRENRERDLILNGAQFPFLATDKVDFDNLSPEATLSWYPTDDLTLFASYREGFKSGGFDASFAPDFSVFSAANPFVALYDPEEVQGFEVGAKASVANDTVRLNAAFYRYEFSDQQQSLTDPTTGTISIVNAASTTQIGFEADVTWTPETVEGLVLRGAFNYNDATYDEFIVDCYAGQTIAQGCDQSFNALRAFPDGMGGIVAAPGFTQQSLAGARLPYAPEFTFNIGGSYDTPIPNSNWLVGLGANVSYSSEYATRTENNPESIQDAFARVAANLRLYDESERYQFSVVGRNLTNEYTIANSFDRPFSGNPLLTGTAVSGGRGDNTAAVSRGREILFQLQFSFH